MISARAIAKVKQDKSEIIWCPLGTPL